jgi:hypothetical protein
MWERHAHRMWDSHHITPGQAQEAVEDIDALWIDPDPTSKTGISVRVVGYSHSLREILCVILIPAEAGRDGWDGVNAWRANSTYRHAYERGET